MPDPAGVVRAFYERMQARDWDGAGELLDPGVQVRYTATGERFVGSSFLDMNRAYPEGWTILVEEALSAGDRVASQVRVDHGGDEFWCAGFYTVRDGRIVDGVEHWVTARSETPPEWRRPFRDMTVRSPWRNDGDLRLGARRRPWRLVLRKGQAVAGSSRPRGFAPSLTGLAERSHLLSPAVDLDTHITDVVELLYYWDLRDVVLVGHSYGGMVVTGIADRAAERIGKLVYLDAANPTNGQSLVDVAGLEHGDGPSPWRSGRRHRARTAPGAGRRRLLRRDRP